MDFKDILLIDSDKIIRFASTSKNIINEKLKHNANNANVHADNASGQFNDFSFDGFLYAALKVGIAIRKSASIASTVVSHSLLNKK